MTNLLWPGDHRAGPHMTDQALLRSMVVTWKQGGVRWRGTLYTLEELRKNAGQI